MDIERTMQFIVEQQAQFASEIHELKEAGRAQEERFEREMIRINNVLFEVTSSQARTNKILETVAERHVELTDTHRRDITNINAVLVELAEANKRDITNISEMLVDVTSSQQRTNAILEVLAEKHVELATAQKVTEEKLIELASAQKVTEEKLHVCIDTVERHIAHHNSSQG